MDNFPNHSIIDFYLHPGSMTYLPLESLRYDEARLAMPKFDVESREITAFEVGGSLLFKKYFERDELFDHLRKYYNSDKYRFEIQEDEIEDVRQILDYFYYELSVAENLERYCVVADENSDTTELIKNSVMRTRSSGQEVYVMKDSLAVKQAIERGAAKLAEQESIAINRGVESTDRTGAGGAYSGSYKYRG